MIGFVIFDKKKIIGWQVLVHFLACINYVSLSLSLWYLFPQCLYGCYVHSSIIPTFHRRCYWLLQVKAWLLLHVLSVGVCVPMQEFSVHLLVPLPSSCATEVVFFFFFLQFCNILLKFFNSYLPLYPLYASCSVFLHHPPYFTHLLQPCECILYILGSLPHTDGRPGLL